MFGAKKHLGLVLLASGAFVLRLLVAAFHTPSPQTAPLAWQFMQCFAGTALVMAVLWLAWLLMPDDRQTGWIAAIIAAVYPPHLALVCEAHPSIWTALLLAATLIIVLARPWRGTNRGVIVAGCLAGLLVPTEPALLSIVPVCMVLAWLAEGDTTWVDRFGREAIGRLFLLLGVFLLVLVPWFFGPRPQSGSPLNIASPRGIGGSEHFAIAKPSGDDFSALATAEERSSAELRRVFAVWRQFIMANGLGSAGHFSGLAAVALFVTALLGAPLAWERRRQIWPLYVIATPALIAAAAGGDCGSLRTSLDPLLFLWAVLAVAPTFSRVPSQQAIRVYRPGELARDPFDGPHVLRGPHVSVEERRRAG